MWISRESVHKQASDLHKHCPLPVEEKISARKDGLKAGA